MARFYLDENVAEALVSVLILLGHIAVSTTQLGRKGASDPEQLNTAVDLNSILVTHNEADFRMLHEAWLSWSTRWGVSATTTHPGILVIPQALRLNAQAMGTALDAVVSAESTLANRLLIRTGSGAWTEPA